MKWDILNYLKHMLYIFYIASVGLPVVVIQQFYRLDYKFYAF